LDANEALAAQLVVKLQAQSARDAFAAARERFLKIVGDLTKPEKAGDKKAAAAHKARMASAGQAYSMEQINWRTARVVSQNMQPEHVKELLASLNEVDITSLLQKVNVASAASSAVVTEQMLSSTEFRELMTRLLKGP
jgi:hypothetical protein